MRLAIITLCFTFLYSTPLCLTHPQVPQKSSQLVFLAGTISTPWRAQLTTLLQSTDYTLLSPAHGPQVKRIEWEQTYIDRADILVMWISANKPGDPYTLSLTSLFELGRFTHMNKPLYIGIEPGYALRDELILQLRALRPELIIHESLEALAKTLIGTTKNGTS
ncbi:MAG: nucleoside 2-deoxyribosyltransferase domain-containing protein [Simkaniaceae bacterium]|nr:nucleoside 2-deoxyribosyltransferase domain-containing protein [Simkaniaceae bacterium]